MIPMIHRSIYDLRSEDIDYERADKLPDAISCKVKEELNDEYVLDIEYPKNGQNAELLKEGKIIIAKPNEVHDMQPFTVTRVDRSLKGKTIKVHAEHISYRMNGIMLPPTRMPLTTLKAVRDYINTAGLYNPFSVYTDLNIDLSPAVEFNRPLSAKKLIRDVSKQMPDAFELVYNRKNISMSSKRGGQRTVDIIYASNMTDIGKISDICSMPNWIYPYCILKNAENKDVYIERGSFRDQSPDLHMVVVPLSPNQAVLTGQACDITDYVASEYRGQGGAETFLAAGAGTNSPFFNAHRAWARANAMERIPDALTVSYVDLARTCEYMGILQRQLVGIGDFANVIMPEWDVSTTQEIVGVTYDVLRDRYDSIQIGAPKNSFAKEIVKMIGGR